MAFSQAGSFLNFVSPPASLSCSRGFSLSLSLDIFPFISQRSKAITVALWMKERALGVGGSTGLSSPSLPLGLRPQRPGEENRSQPGSAVRQSVAFGGLAAGQAWEAGLDGAASFALLCLLPNRGSLCSGSAFPSPPRSNPFFQELKAPLALLEAVPIF